MMMMKFSTSLAQSWVLGLAFHLAAWILVLLAIYFSMTQGEWWPIAVVLPAVLAVDVVLIYQQWRRNATFHLRKRTQGSDTVLNVKRQREIVVRRQRQNSR
jgi:hypothetical protein